MAKPAPTTDSSGRSRTIKMVVAAAVLLVAVVLILRQVFAPASGVIRPEEGTGTSAAENSGKQSSGLPPNRGGAGVK